MSYPRLRPALALALSAALTLGTACRDVTAPAAPAAPAPDASLLGLIGTPTLIQCPTTATSTASGLIDALGGTISVNGASIVIPAGAVLQQTLFTVTMPASQYVKVDITATDPLLGPLTNYRFQLPATVRLSYARCGRGWWMPLTAWYVDSSTNALLQNMLGVDDKLTRAVIFTTLHLSSYAVAN